MFSTSNPHRFSLVTFQLSLLILGLFVTGQQAAPHADELQEIYLETCESSCSLVSDNDEAHDCREKFCPNYVSFLLTGSTLPDSTPSLASSHRKEVKEFCATWVLHLIEQLGWQTRNRLKLKECICAAGKDCLL